ncbi:MAG TPA: ribosome-associated translation inhibitor RaiA [Negativicutes bacterium]|nr:ribosome-associated translation inhibitor RaiA [Negativicutes bacterium]
MQIIIKAKGIEVNQPLESFINKKIGGLKKFLGSFENHQLPVTEGRQLFDTFVEVERETNHHRQGKIFMASAKIYMPGKSLFAKANGEDIISAISEVRDELETEIRKYKSKIVEFPVRKAKQSQNR